MIRKLDFEIDTYQSLNYLSMAARRKLGRGWRARRLTGQKRHGPRSTTICLRPD
jgi:hypothetical protein